VADLIGVGRGASVYAGYPYYDAIGYTQVGHLPTGDDTKAGDKIVDYIIQNSENPVLSEEAGLIFRVNQKLGRTTQPIITNPTQLLNLWNSSALDPTNLIAEIDQQNFGMIILRAQFYPPPVLQAIGARYAPYKDVFMNGFQYRILIPRNMPLPGCDEAGFYGFVSSLRKFGVSNGSFKIASRNTSPDGWAGPDGVSLIEYQSDEKNQVNRVAYRLWIAPLDWRGQPPANGSGAKLLATTRCFQFFDEILDNAGIGEKVRQSVTSILGIGG
jgi:hypothetical protein